MSQPKIKLPVRPRSYRFAMTPLADAMFQLLIFFMLTSSLTPYSLLTVQTAAAQPDASTSAAGPDTATQTPPTPPSEVANWTLEADRILVGGQVFTFDSLDLLADALGSDLGPAEVIIIVRDSARVQDLATVLARLSTANVQSVRVAENEA